MIKPSLYDYTLKELQQLIKPSFRAKQIYGWMYHHYIDDYTNMKNIPKALQEELNTKYIINPLSIIKKEISSDGTIKYLLELHHGKTMEAVWLKMKDDQYNEDGESIQEAKYTICVSTEVGCKVGGAFWLTAKGGFTRDLNDG